MPRAATLRESFEQRLVHSIALLRDTTPIAAQPAYVDFSVEGQELAKSAISSLPADGHASTAVGVAVYWKVGANVAVGDQFVYDGVQYRIGGLSPKGVHSVFGETMRISWAEGDR